MSVFFILLYRKACAYFTIEMRVWCTYSCSSPSVNCSSANFPMHSRWSDSAVNKLMKYISHVKICDAFFLNSLLLYTAACTAWFNHLHSSRLSTVYIQLKPVISKAYFWPHLSSAFSIHDCICDNMYKFKSAIRRVSTWITRMRAPY